MFNSTAVKTKKREGKKLNCVYLDKFHCLLLSFHRLLKQHKIFYEEQFINQHLGSSNRELSYQPALVESSEWEKKWKSEEIHKSTRDGSRFSFGGKISNHDSVEDRWNKKATKKQLLLLFTDAWKVFSSIKSRLS